MDNALNNFNRALFGENEAINNNTIVNREDSRENYFREMEQRLSQQQQQQQQEPNLQLNIVQHEQQDLEYDDEWYSSTGRRNRSLSAQHHPYQRVSRIRRNSDVDEARERNINFSNLIRIERNDSNMNLFQRQINQHNPDQFVQRNDIDQEILQQHVHQQEAAELQLQAQNHHFQQNAEQVIQYEQNQPQIELLQPQQQHHHQQQLNQQLNQQHQQQHHQQPQQQHHQQFLA